MKFVTLALALLLAVGSQAASLQADAPSQLAHARSVVDMYLTQVKDSIKKALVGLDDTEYSDLKSVIANRLDEMHTQLKTVQGQVSPMTDSFVNTITDATADLRKGLVQDFESLKADLEPKQAHLKSVLDKHFQEYRTEMEPIMTEYYAKHNAEMEELKAKMQPVVESLRAKAAVNVEETKAALIPMVEAVRTKVQQRLEALKTMFGPYIEEYKEQIREAYMNVKKGDSERLTEIGNKLSPLVEDIKTNLQAMFAIIAESASKH